MSEPMIPRRLACSTIILGAAVLATIGAGAVAQAASGDARGLWLSDTRDGVVEIRSCGAALCAHLYAILDPKVPQNAPDVHNEKPRLRTRPICGLPIMGDLKPEGPGTWDDGWVYDPKSGKTYSVEISLRGPQTLVVHGYMGMKMLGRTVTWTRLNRHVARCTGRA